MRLLAWNLNHRATEKPIARGVAEAIRSFAADVIVLTEYVPGTTRTAFADSLAEAGLKYQLWTPRISRQNSVLVASRVELVRGEIIAPADCDVALPSNVLHVHLPKYECELLAVRVPDYSRTPKLRRACWAWLLDAADVLRDRRAVIMGDLNTDPRYPRSRCGDRFQRLEERGWRRVPSTGMSYWTPRGHGVQIDHALIAPSIDVPRAASHYVTEVPGHVLAGPGAKGLSDHAAVVVDLRMGSAF